MEYRPLYRTKNFGGRGRKFFSEINLKRMRMLICEKKVEFVIYRDRYFCYMNWQLREYTERNKSSRGWKFYVNQTAWVLRIFRAWKTLIAIFCTIFYLEIMSFASKVCVFRNSCIFRSYYKKNYPFFLTELSSTI